MADQPQEGEDGATPAAHGGVELEDPEVGGEVGAAQQDGHVLLWLRLVFTVGRRGHTGVGRGGRGWPGRRHRGAVGEGDHPHCSLLTRHLSSLEIQTSSLECHQSVSTFIRKLFSR